LVSPSTGSVVLVRFPFSDLSASKLRPAIALAGVGRNDWVLCQVTANPYADPLAIEIADSDFERGSLRRTSYARPGKLFTANASLMVTEIGMLKAETHQRLLGAVVELLQKGPELA